MFLFNFHEATQEQNPNLISYYLVISLLIINHLDFIKSYYCKLITDL